MQSIIFKIKNIKKGYCAPNIQESTINKNTLENLSISILGFGITTKPMVEWLNKQDIYCAIFDDKFNEIKKDNNGNVLFPSNTFNPLDSSLKIISPGIPPYHYYAKNTKHLIGEYDFIANLLEEHSAINDFLEYPKIIWISGTNGKTTTTQMLSFLLKDYGAISGGNIGVPLIELFFNRAKIWVLETSSFAMHYTKKATPCLYLLLPLSEDHISWHGSFEAYKDDKLRVLERMNKDSSALLPEDLKQSVFVKKFKGNAIFYKNAKDLATFLAIDINEIKLKEPFLLDGLIALAGAKLLRGVLDKKHIDNINNFIIGEHRIEEFYDKDGFLWVDDSKGTNVDATIQAIKRYSNKQLYIILGGDDKGADCNSLFIALKSINKTSNVHIFAIGSNEKKLLNLAKSYGIEASGCGALGEAVSAIKKERFKHTDKTLFVGLLSPAASSLDQFTSYKQRGEMFKQYALA